MNEQAADVEESESSEPENNENDGEDQEHGTFFRTGKRQDIRALHLAEF